VTNASAYRHAIGRTDTENHLFPYILTSSAVRLLRAVANGVGAVLKSDKLWFIVRVRARAKVNCGIVCGRTLVQTDYAQPSSLPTPMRG